MIFEIIDVDGSGEITKSALRKALRRNAEVVELCKESPTLAPIEQCEQFSLDGTPISPASNNKGSVSAKELDLAVAGSTPAHVSNAELHFWALQDLHT